MAQRPPLRGYNHNIRYKVRVYHVQTEDSGLDNPHVITHLFLDGMIVSSQRKSYVSLLETPDLDARVRSVMQDQHKAMMKQLRRGDLDGRIVGLVGALKPGEAEHEAHVTPPAGYAPPPEESLPPAEARALRRGTRISRVIAPLRKQPTGEIPIPLDHPAFSAIPMIEWDETEDDVLELDLEAINELDLDAPTKMVRPVEDSGVSGIGEELDLDALLEGADDEAAEQALMAPPSTSFPAPLPLEEPTGLDWEPAVPSVDVEADLGATAHREPPLSKHPSLPLPVIREQVDEAVFDPEPAPGADDFADRAKDRQTLTFPAPFKSPSEVQKSPSPKPTGRHEPEKKG